MISRVFLNHPHSVNEGYFQHMGFAAWFAGKLALAAGAALIHALVPCCFEKTASTIIAELYERTHNRGDMPARPATQDGPGDASSRPVEAFSQR